MTTPADILDALGRHDRAAMLRWSEAREPLDAEQERDELAERVGELDEQLDEVDFRARHLDKQLDELLTWAMGNG